MRRHDRVHPSCDPRPRPRRFVVGAAAFLFFIPVAGCETLTSVVLIGEQLRIQLLESTVLDALVTPQVVADAGPDANALTDERVLLDGSSSLVQLGSGGALANPSPTPSFTWRISTTTVDADADGDVDDADLAAAGTRLANADMAVAQFSSPAPGVFTFELTVSWITPQGRTVTGSDTVQVSVFAIAP